MEVVPYDRVKQSPARPAAAISSPAQQLAIQEMRAWKQQFIERRPERQSKAEEPTEHDFFFRKGRQEVLAIIVLKRDQQLEAIRGVNVEVSLPTGTLCAERNAIGTALATHPDLLREEIQCVAVLSLRPGRPRLGPCGACSEWLRKVAEINPDFKVLTFDDEYCEMVYVDPMI